MLGCCYDAGYLPFLGQFAAAQASRERITLLQGRAVVPAAAVGLHFSMAMLGDAFGMEGIGRYVQSSPVPAGPRARNNGSTSTVMAVAKRGVASVRKDPFLGYQLAEDYIYTDRFSTITIEPGNRRIDTELQVDKAVQARIRKSDLCPYLYLRGSCSLEGCRRNHAHRGLTAVEFDALLALTRMGRCRQYDRKDECFDEFCIYGHDKSQYT